MRLKSATTITVSGASQSGKTTLVEKIVKLRDEIFSKPISKVFWFCAYIPMNKLENVTYVQGIPNNINEILIPDCLVIIDDFMHELSNSNMLTSLMTKVVHHKSINLIYITQNLFQKSNDNKTRRLNTNYLIIFKNPQDKTQVDYLGRQMFPRDKDFLRLAFDDATQHAYSYLMIDCNQETPDEVRVRTNIVKDGEMKVYIPFSLSV